MQVISSLLALITGKDPRMAGKMPVKVNAPYNAGHKSAGNLLAKSRNTTVSCIFAISLHFGGAGKLSVMGLRKYYGTLI